LLFFFFGHGRCRPGQRCLSFVDDGHRETKVVAKCRFGLELVDGDANGDANVEEIRRDALRRINKATNKNKRSVSLTRTELT
jgi:hypothetical protein